MHRNATTPDRQALDALAELHRSETRGEIVARMRARRVAAWLAGEVGLFAQASRADLEAEGYVVEAVR